MIELYLVRHGETELNVKGVYYGWTDCALTENGIRQSQRLSDIFKDITFDAVISSNLKRAADTAAIISGLDITEIKLDERLRERNFGCWEGLHFTDLQRDHKEQWDIWCNDWKNAVIPEGESINELYTRVKACLMDIINTYKEGKILIVTHHGCLRLIPVILMKLELEAFWSFVYEQGKYSVLQIDNGNCVLRKINSVE